MSDFKGTTDFETRTIRQRIEAGEFLPPAVQRITGTSAPYGGVFASYETNDSDDDGWPDGEWESWTDFFPSVQNFKKNAGICRVGVSGVIVTVILDGEELHDENR